MLGLDDDAAVVGILGELDACGDEGVGRALVALGGVGRALVALGRASEPAQERGARSDLRRASIQASDTERTDMA
jgi:hypothetical protein